MISDPRLAKSLMYASNKRYRQGCWLHTLGPGGLLPRSYFEEHPEYFGVDHLGKRDPGITPCLTHPDVLPIVVKNARQWLTDRPGSNIISVSQSDKPWRDFCHCPNCGEAGKKFTYRTNENPLGRFPYGNLPGWADPKLTRPAWDPAGAEFNSPVGATGLLLEFVNRVAGELQKDHPDVLVHTLAYYWTMYPPEEIALHPNVVLELAPLNSCRYHRLPNCRWSEGFKGSWTALRRWRKLTPHTWVWIYDTMNHEAVFRQHPALKYLDLYFRQLKHAEIRGVYIAANGLDRWYWMNDLRSYVTAKLLWDPEYDVEKGMEEFAGAYYGNAAEAMLVYLKSTQEAANYEENPAHPNPVQKRVHGFHGFGGYVKATKEAIRRWDGFFDEAEDKAADEPEFLERVKLARLSVQYSAMELLDADDPVRVKAYGGFFPAAKDAGVEDAKCDRLDLEKLKERFKAKN